MDLVYPVRGGPSDSFEELRYSLRSAAAMLDLDQVWLLGSAPRWATGVNHLRLAQNNSKYVNVRKLMRAACESPYISDEFVWMNDDVFFMHEQRIRNMRMLHGGPLSVYLSRLGRRDSYTQGGRKTIELLQKQGYPDPLNWGLHTPLVVRDKATMLDALDLVGESTTAYHIRSIYGALAGLDGEQHSDVKIMKGTGISPTWPYVSTSDLSFKTRQVGVQIRARFNTPSRFEA